MELFLFLDDWMLDARRDLIRRFPRPVPAPVPHLIGRPCHLEMRLFCARLYAVRWDCQVIYGKAPLERI